MRRVWCSMVLAVLSACPATSGSDAGPVDDAGMGQLLLVFDGDFGEVERFHVAESPARFINVGKVPASVSRLSVEGEGFSIGTSDGSPIAPGASRDVPVNFRPTRNGAHRARISFQATTLPVLAHFSMVGTGVGALVKVPDELDLGSQVISDFQTLRVDGTLRVENVGDRWLYFPSARPWVVSPAEELCLGDVDRSTGACLGTVQNVDVTAGVAPGRTLELPVHFVSTVPGRRAWTITLETSLPDAPVVTVPVRIDVRPLPTCRLVMEESGVDFGDLEPMHAVDRTFTLRNDGTVSCTGVIPRVMRGLEHFAVVEPRDWPRNLRAGERLPVTVRALPAVERDVVTGSVMVGGRVLDLSANVLATPCVAVTAPPSLGTWSPGCAPPTRTVVLTNRCAQAVQLTRLSAAPEPFMASPGSLPRTIAANASVGFQLSTTALPAGEHRATWTAEVQTDFGPEVHRREVSARVADGGREVQRALEKVDVLVVFDQFAPAASAAQTGLASLYSLLSNTGVDFHLGLVISNQDDGVLSFTPAGTPWLSRDAGSDVAWQTVLANGGGSQPGQGLGSLIKAMSDPTINRGFFRADASSVVVMIGSSADHGEPGLDTQVLAFRPGVRDLVVFAVECGAAASAMQQRLVTATGGTMTSCAGSWPTLLNDVTAAVNGARSRMLISSDVAPGTLSVTGLNTSAWAYAAPWLTIPEGRVNIEATFTPVCR